MSRERTFIALYDYDPYTMGTTDRPDLQLSLKKGDHVIVLGDEDVEGYFTAVVNGNCYLRFQLIEKNSFEILLKAAIVLLHSCHYIFSHIFH